MRNFTFPAVQFVKLQRWDWYKQSNLWSGTALSVRTQTASPCSSYLHGSHLIKWKCLHLSNTEILASIVSFCLLTKALLLGAIFVTSVLSSYQSSVLKWPGQTEQSVTFQVKLMSNRNLYFIIWHKLKKPWNDICALLGFNAAQKGSFSPTFREKLPVLSSRAKKSWRGNRYVVPKHRQVITVLRYVKSAKRVDPIHTATQVSNHAPRSCTWFTTS